MGLVRLDEPSRTTPDAAAAFIAEVDPAGLVQVVRATPEAAFGSPTTVA